MPHRRTVYFVSDRTGITAEMLGNSLLTQFEDFEFRRVTIPFVDSDERVADAIRQVNETVDPEGRRPIVISSVVDEAMSARIRREANALTLDFFQARVVGSVFSRQPSSATLTQWLLLFFASGAYWLGSVGQLGL